MSQVLASGAAIGALYLLGRRPTTDIPASVSRSADDEVRRAPVDPCSGAGAGDADDFTRLYVEQKRALIAKYGGAMEWDCGATGAGYCWPIPSRQIPKAPWTCTRDVIDQWVGIAGRLVDRSETPENLVEDLNELAGALTALRFRTAITGLDDGANRRIWSTIARLSIVLAGVHVHHGDAQREAREDLADDLTDPANYLGVVLDAAARFVQTGLGAAVAFGGIVYLATRRGL